MMAFSRGAGYGDPSDRHKALARGDLDRGYISAETAARGYGMSTQVIEAVAAAVSKGRLRNGRQDGNTKTRIV